MTFRSVTEAAGLSFGSGEGAVGLFRFWSEKGCKGEMLFEEKWERALEIRCVVDAVRRNAFESVEAVKWGEIF